LQIGTQLTNSVNLEGTIQEITIFPSDKTTDLTELHTDINDYYFVYPTKLYDEVSVMYTLRQPEMTRDWTNAVLTLTRSSDNASFYVFFDNDGKYSYLLVLFRLKV